MHSTMQYPIKAKLIILIHLPSIYLHKSVCASVFALPGIERHYQHYTLASAAPRRALFALLSSTASVRWITYSYS